MKQKQNLNTCFRINLLHFVYFHLLLAFLIAVFASIFSHFFFAIGLAASRGKEKLIVQDEKVATFFYPFSVHIINYLARKSFDGKTIFKERGSRSCLYLQFVH